MNPLRSTAVTFAGGEAIIDAEVLAPAIGLSPDALKDEMREGLVYSVAELVSARVRDAPALPLAIARSVGSSWCCATEHF